MTDSAAYVKTVIITAVVSVLVYVIVVVAAVVFVFVRRGDKKSPTQ